MEWWQNFEKAAKANNWNDERQFVLAPTYLRKAADIWYKSLRPGQRPLDIEEFKNAFLQQFRTPTKIAEWRSQFELCKQNHGETVDQYTARFRELLGKIYTDPNAQNLYLHQYIRGLRSELIRLGNVASKNNFNDAMEAAKAAEITAQYSAISEALNPPMNKVLLTQQQEVY
jgi:hypothetical protein